MARLDVNPDTVADTGDQVAAAGSVPTPPATAINPPARDPVSVAVAHTMSVRVSAIAGYSAAAAAIADTFATMIKTSSTSYRHQEKANATAVNGGRAPATAASSMPVTPMAPLPAPTTQVPSIGAPPASGRAIAELIHSGPGATDLYTAAHRMHQHATELRATANQLRSSAGDLNQDWDSAAGHEASSRVTDLATWFDTHANHAAAAATTLEQQGDIFGRARSGIPTPERFADTQRRLEAAMMANKAPGSLGRYAPIIAQLQIEMATLSSEAMQGYAVYSANAANPSVVVDPLEAPPRPGGDIRALGNDLPLSPATGDDPPHDSDPRYWLDTSKIIHVAEGHLAPYGYIQVGPDLYHPDPDPGYSHSPPPPPSRYPLDVSDIVTRPPGNLGPNGYQLIAETDDTWYWTPDPSAGYQAQSPWPAPEQPIDVREIINVPRGQLAPRDYVEYLPEWFAPGPQLTDSPTVPRPR